MSFLFDLHNRMEDNDIIMVYQGDFSQDLIKTVLTFTELKFSTEDLGNSVRRRLFNLMVECLQNVSKHQFKGHHDDPRKSSMFMIGYTDEDYLIVSSNPIHNRHIPKLEEMLEKVNSLDKDGLKQLYKQARLENKFSDSAGAGIGIIDMARKSGKKLDYNFETIDDDLSVYSLMVRVPKIDN
ncbi:MAG: hypothetical protein GY790_10420 [Bacteroidetes bacterium]|nr:hypothetical protein [Bacteroidota bacterium]